MVKSPSYLVQLRSNVGQSCRECGDGTGWEGDIAAQANHYMIEHGYRVVHVGQETERASDGSLWHSTAIVIGTDDPAAAARIGKRLSQAVEFRAIDSDPE